VAALEAVAVYAEGCDLDSLDGYQQWCRSDAVSKGAHGVFPHTAYSNSAGTMASELCSSLSPAECTA
jgi:hypothetical protein